MQRVVILGSASAVSDEHHENSHLLVQIGDRVILVDCVGNPIVRLKKAGIHPAQVQEIILTHFHPDHVSGFPLLLMDMWLMGRNDSLKVIGVAHTIERAQKMMDLYEWDRWPNFFPVQFIAIEEQAMTPLLDDQDVLILASPVKHLLPTIGLRFLFKNNGKVFSYSSDTEPCQAVVELAKDADVLLHEATGLSIGHTSREQCGEIATQANAKQLYLTHYPPESDPEVLRHQSQSTFAGPVVVATDFLNIDLT